MYRNKHIYWLLAAFALCLAVRIYFISEKKGLDGDEHTSFTLAYNAIGWGDNDYKEGIVYTAEELRQCLLVDDIGGLDGYFKDIASLWRYNRDASHASLYYMFLRTALIGQDAPDLNEAVARGCGLNLLFFAVSFWLMVRLLRRLFPRSRFVPAILLLAYLNPASLSITVLIREYQLAEMLLTAFLLLTVTLYQRITAHQSLFSVKYIVTTAAIVALFVSAGYFNAIFVFAVSVYLGYKLMKAGRAKELLFFPVVAVLSLALCLALYKGFFNFFTDVRTGEVMLKLSGEGFGSNIYYSIGAAVKLFFLDIFGAVMSGGIVIVAVYAVIKKVKLPKCDYNWLLIITLTVFFIVLILSTWKLLRYVSLYIPLITVFFAFNLFEVVNKRKMVILLAAIFVVTNLSAGRVKFLFKENVPFPKDEKMYLYATYVDDRNTLSLLIPRMNDGQKVQIVSNIEHIDEYNADGKAAVFAANEMPALLTDPHCVTSSLFNPWLSLYIIAEKQ